MFIELQLLHKMRCSVLHSILKIASSKHMDIMGPMGEGGGHQPPRSTFGKSCAVALLGPVNKLLKIDVVLNSMFYISLSRFC